MVIAQRGLVSLIEDLRWQSLHNMAQHIRVADGEFIATKLCMEFKLSFQ